MAFKIGDKVRSKYIITPIYWETEDGKFGRSWKEIAAREGMQERIPGHRFLIPDLSRVFVEGYFVGIRHKQNGHREEGGVTSTWDGYEPDPPFFAETAPRTKVGLICETVYSLPILVPFDRIEKVEESP